MKLEEHLFIAKEAAEYAKSIIIYGSSNKKDSKIGHDQIVALKQKLKISNSKNLNKSAFIRLKKQVKIISEFQIGNCFEHTILAYYYIVNKYNVNASMIDFHNIDHCFLLIGADNSTDVYKWGDMAVICDPWDNRYYPAKFAFIFLKSTFGYMFSLSMTSRQISDNDLPKLTQNDLTIDQEDFDQVREKINFSHSYDFNFHDNIYPLKLGALFTFSSIFTMISCSLSKKNLELDCYAELLLFITLVSSVLTVKSLVTEEKNLKILSNLFKVN